LWLIKEKYCINNKCLENCTQLSTMGQTNIFTVLVFPKPIKIWHFLEIFILVFYEFVVSTSKISNNFDSFSAV